MASPNGPRIVNPPASAADPELGRVKGKRSKTTAEHCGHPVTVGNPVSPASAASPVEGLTLGPGLMLPVEAVTETFAILGQTRRGEDLHRRRGWWRR